MFKPKMYNVRGLLRRGDVVKRFSTVVQARSARKANNIVKSIISDYCDDNYPNKDKVLCIINKKTVRYN